ncbi:MAG: ribbon-helix-helix domain-containing protein [bacterium]
MRNSVTFTSTISPELISLLNDYSKKMKTPKSRLISIAVKNYINELKKEEYTKSFQKAKNDIEIKNLTEDGIEDFLEILDK